VKRDLVQDPRYDAVGSSSLREELFNAFLKASASSTEIGQSVETKDSQLSKDAEKSESKRERKERAVKEREEKVKAERERLEANIGRSKMELNKEEGELQFKYAFYPKTVVFIIDRCATFFCLGLYSQTPFENHRYSTLLS